MKNELIGGFFILSSIILALFDFNINGAAINFNDNFSIMGILTITFFLTGLIFLSKLEKKVIGGLITVGSVIGGYHILKDNSPNAKDEEHIKIISPQYTTQGRFERTYRWDDALDKAEAKYGIPRGMLKGLAMRESYGDPLKLNSGNDGGAGLFMFQPGTAKEMGLKVYGNSNRTGRDRKHGDELRKLLKEKKYNYEEMAKIDERFHVIKSSDAAGKFLKKLYKRYGSWEKALSAYNRGKPAIDPGSTQHVKKTKEYQNYYNKRDPD
ncbi:MAG: transglycosylase SLT domain-containing protein [Nanoarchaeota archaeon]|nr:transglycosylase SLT domain-containing protein [Nanoarchaeota archaeon]